MKKQIYVIYLELIIVWKFELNFLSIYHQSSRNSTNIVMITTENFIIYLSIVDHSTTIFTAKIYLTHLYMLPSPK